MDEDSVFIGLDEYAIDSPGWIIGMLSGMIRQAA
jgi:hypothetical protein